jgi:hypothetical protein
VTFARARKRAVQLEEARLWGSANEAAREESEPAGAGGVRGGGADHHRPDYVQQTNHPSRLRVSNRNFAA